MHGRLASQPAATVVRAVVRTRFIPRMEALMRILAIVFILVVTFPLSLRGDESLPPLPFAQAGATAPANKIPGRAGASANLRAAEVEERIY